MSRKREYRRIRIFIASPSDVGEDRACLLSVISELNQSGNAADALGFTLEGLDWRTHVAPLMGRAKQVILDQLPVETWDVFVGMFWLRFGSSTGGVDPQTNLAFDSGTEEEFTRALTACHFFHSKVRCMRTC